jgi:hydrogenase maturation protein HypF
LPCNYYLPAVETWHIHITGQVQGVGFRPFVYKLALKLNLNGWVNNTLDGVHIEVNAQESQVRNFLEMILGQAPVLARITGYSLRETEPKMFQAFEIVSSEVHGEANLLLTPDVALCPDCRRELKTASDRRYGYPFITCTNCGPRFSIIRTLPYDRPRTTMAPFVMCSPCDKEYNNPLDRRHFSQTNSCPNCPVELSLFQYGKLKTRDQQEAVQQTLAAWKEGKIVAIKGIGGYLLTCDATREDTISRLRERKFRPTKPFALMYPDLATVAGDVLLREEEARELEGQAAPILLLDLKEKPASGICAAQLAPGLDQIGLMLPYAPLFELLLSRFGKPIVATSANRSSAPIVYRDEEALKELSELADLVLMNNREIVIPQDDSVCRYAPVSGKRIIIRRSRGWAPTYIKPDIPWPEQAILATGAMLKSTFSLLCHQNAYISQYLGDLQNFETEESYRHTVEHFFSVFRKKPEIILVDKHPQYPSTVFGESLADSMEVNLVKVQHHLAHFGAVLAENDLLHASEAVLGVIWDGTGLGNDKNIWGGEFFHYEDYLFKRYNHLAYFPAILGDKMPREPRISALATCYEMDEAKALLKRKFSDVEWSLYTRMLEQHTGLMNSSMGRLFDAVTSLLGIMDKSSYEGEAAMLLEQEAWRYVRKHGLTFSESYLHPEDFPAEAFPLQKILRGILKDIQEKREISFIAGKFHYSLVKGMEYLAREGGFRKIAFSGGVFQNALLVDLIEAHLGEAFELYFHRELSPNDESVSFGQLICYIVEKKRISAL